jgi:hypothetical protein
VWCEVRPKALAGARGIEDGKRAGIHVIFGGVFSAACRWSHMYSRGMLWPRDMAVGWLTGSPLTLNGVLEALMVDCAGVGPGTVLFGGISLWFANTFVLWQWKWRLNGKKRKGVYGRIRGEFNCIHLSPVLLFFYHASFSSVMSMRKVCIKFPFAGALASV